MATMVETVESCIGQEPEALTEVTHDTTHADGSTIENQLTQEISELWSSHVRLNTSRKVTSKELRQIRDSLAERLYAMKSLLSHPGRGGQWHSWLREQGIPRSTADRLASRHAETLGGDIADVPTGEISEPAKPTAEKLAETVWSSLKKVLITGEFIVQFIGCIAKVSGVPHEWREEGLVVFNAVPEATDGLPGSASAPDPDSQPSDDASGDTEETTAETATTPTAAVQAAVVADTSDDVV